MRDYTNCPRCDACVSIKNGKLANHERGLGYVPYRLYHRIARIGKLSVRKQYDSNICKVED